MALGQPGWPTEALAFLSDLAYNAQTRVEYKGLTGEATSYLAYASLLADAETLPSLIAALVGLGALGARASRSGPEGRKALVLALAFAAPFVLVASGGHRAMRFLAPAWPALAWLAAEALGSVRDRLPRRLASAAVVARAAVAALLVLRLFLVDSRGLATRFLAEHVPPGATIDLIANHAGYAPEAPEGRALRIVPTLSREMAPPLITNSDGSKFGKSLGGAIYLDSNKTSVYKYYQFWIRTDDRDVIRYLKYFTFLTPEEIADLEKQHNENPGARAAHKALAKAMTDIIHGPNATTDAMRASEILFGGDLAGIPERTFNEIVGEVPTKEMPRSQLDGAGVPLVETLVLSGLSPSKGQARKDIEGGGVYLNNIRDTGFQRLVTVNDLLFGKHLLLRKGKRNYVVMTAT